MVVVGRDKRLQLKEGEDDFFISLSLEARELLLLSLQDNEELSLVPRRRCWSAVGKENQLLKKTKR